MEKHDSPKTTIDYSHENWHGREKIVKKNKIQTHQTYKNRRRHQLIERFNHKS